MAIKKQSFMKGIAVVLGAQIIIKLFGFLYRVILTNIEGFQDIGNSYYSSGYKVYIFMLAIATTGVPSAISKLVSEKVAEGNRLGAHRIFKVCLLIFTMIGLFFSLFLFLNAEYIAVNWLSNPGVKYTLATLAPAVLLVTIAGVFRGYFIGLGNVSAHSVAQVIEQIINSILSIVFVYMLLGNSPEIMAMGSTAATAVSTLASLLYLYLYYKKNREQIWKEIRSSAKFKPESVRKITRNVLKYTIPIAITSIVSSLVGMIDLITVVENLTKYFQNFGNNINDALILANEKYGILSGKADVLVAIPFSLNIAIVTPLIPLIAGHLAKGEKDQAVTKINSSMKFSSILAFPCAIGLIILADPIFAVLFPNAPEGAYLLKIEAICIFIALAAQTAESALVGVGKLYAPTISIVCGAIVKYLINITFIPIYGESMAAWSTICYHVVDGIISISVLYISLKVKPDFKNIIFKPILATAFMGLFTILTQKICNYVNLGITISLVLSIGVAVIVYGYSLIKFNVFEKDEVTQLPFGNKLKNILKK